MANRTLSVGSAVNDRGATETERRKIMTAIGAVLPIGCAFLAGACGVCSKKRKSLALKRKAVNLPLRCQMHMGLSKAHSGNFHVHALGSVPDKVKIRLTVCQEGSSCLAC